VVFISPPVVVGYSPMNLNFELCRRWDAPFWVVQEAERERSEDRRLKDGA